MAKRKPTINEKSFALLGGVDDATKCPCIGSIFISGVVADKKTIAAWKKVGVKDSKLIAPKKRERLAAIIKRTALAYVIAEITPAMIDDKQLNLNDWEMAVVLSIVQQLYEQSHVATVLIDNWEVSTARFHARFASLCPEAGKCKELPHGITLDSAKLLPLTLVPEHYADMLYTVVGAASILSKTSSDQQYAEYKQIYGDFGSGNPGDPKTRRYVWEHRHTPTPIIRTSWVTFKVLSQLDRIEDDLLYGRGIQKLLAAQE
jgi:ribonuclease HII